MRLPNPRVCVALVAGGLSLLAVVLLIPDGEYGGGEVRFSAGTENRVVPPQLFGVGLSPDLHDSRDSPHGAASRMTKAELAGIVLQLKHSGAPALLFSRLADLLRTRHADDPAALATLLVDAEWGGLSPRELDALQAVVLKALLALVDGEEAARLLAERLPGEPPARLGSPLQQFVVLHGATFAQDERLLAAILWPSARFHLAEDETAPGVATFIARWLKRRVMSGEDPFRIPSMRGRMLMLFAMAASGNREYQETFSSRFVKLPIHELLAIAPSERASGRDKYIAGAFRREWTDTLRSTPTGVLETVLHAVLQAESCPDRAAKLEVLLAGASRFDPWPLPVGRITRWDAHIDEHPPLAAAVLAASLAATLSTMHGADAQFFSRVAQDREAENAVGYMSVPAGWAILSGAAVHGGNDDVALLRTALLAWWKANEKADAKHLMTASPHEVESAQRVVESLPWPRDLLEMRALHLSLVLALDSISPRAAPDRGAEVASVLADVGALDVVDTLRDVARTLVPAARLRDLGIAPATLAEAQWRDPIHARRLAETIGLIRVLASGSELAQYAASLRWLALHHGSRDIQSRAARLYIEAEMDFSALASFVREGIRQKRDGMLETVFQALPARSRSLLGATADATAALYREVLTSSLPLAVLVEVAESSASNARAWNETVRRRLAAAFRSMPELQPPLVEAVERAAGRLDPS